MTRVLFHSKKKDLNHFLAYRLHYLIWSRDFDAVAKYIRSNTFEMFEFERIDPRGRTPLHLAISLGEFELARMLLVSGTRGQYFKNLRIEKVFDLVN